MNWKRLLLVVILGAVVAACVVYLVLPRSLKLVYVLDSVHLATIHPHDTFADATCPYDGSNLTRIVLIDEADGADAVWRAAFICEAEGIFWVFNYWGGMGKFGWYGPFDRTWDEANRVATIVADGAGIVLVVVLVEAVYREDLARKNIAREAGTAR